MSEPTKQELIDSLRKINAVRREHLPKDFCDMFDDLLLEVQDVATEEIQ